MAGALHDDPGVPNDEQLLQEQQLARVWSREARVRGDTPAYLVDVWRDAISARGLPAVLVLGAQEGYLDAGPLPGGWAVYLPPTLRDSHAMLDLLRSRLAAGPAHQSEADVPPHVVTDKLEAFLRQHPYTPALVVNVINPGTAALVVDALVALEARRRTMPPVRYVVRL